MSHQSSRITQNGSEPLDFHSSSDLEASSLKQKDGECDNHANDSVDELDGLHGEDEDENKDREMCE